jgi:hypothetical protein
MTPFTTSPEAPREIGDDEMRTRSARLAPQRSGRLPLEPALSARLAKINELPPDPPQHLLPNTATYLEGLATL